MKIAILFGAKSYEHEISIVSAIYMRELLREELIYIFCDENRRFFLIPTNEADAKLFSSGGYKKYDEIFIKQNGFFLKTLFKEKQIEFDILLNLVHGADGEDGKLASLLEFFNIKFIGPRLEASVLSFNKLYTKMYAKEIGVKILDYELITKRNSQNIKTSYPFIIKPLRLGSSIGVSIVNSASEVDYALDVAFEFDDEVLIEPFIKNVKEYNVAGIYSDKFELSIIEEPKKEDFLDFKKKYLDFSSSSTVNKADISKSLQERLYGEFMKIYNTLFAGALIRCDFFVIEDEIYLNEINPIPGSMGNYLFDDFEKIIKNIANNIPSYKNIKIEYNYLHSILSAK